MTYEDFLREWQSPSPTLTVHTSGSTGKPKAMTVEKERMLASAVTTCKFLGLKEGDTALLCMSLDYIAGKMMAVRAIACGLRLTCIEPCGHPLRGLKDIPDFVAMVPMQVYNTLQEPQERDIMRQIRHVIIGGGAIDEHMEAELKAFPNNIWSTYGMTETLSHIALRRISGKQASMWYEPFEDVCVWQNGDGCLVIDAPKVCAARLTTNDIVEMHADGRRFRIIGRRDNVVCTGGVKLQIEEIERHIRPHLHVPFMITKCADPKFGETVVLLIEGTDTAEAERICREHLTPYERPKRCIAVERLPLTETGKPARAVAARIAATSQGRT